jgi:hypothetical protein
MARHVLAVREHAAHGQRALALEHARAAATHAGDAGHVRLRAMALLMLARVADDPTERASALARARAIATALEDVVLLDRCAAAARRG